MSFSYSRLADIQYIEATTPKTLYFNPSGGAKSYIRSLVLFNGNTTTETTKLYMVPDSATATGTAGASNQFAELSLLTKETLIYDFKYPITMIDPNDTLQGSTTTASKVTIQVLGAIDV